MGLTPRIDRLQQNYIINGDMRIAQRGTSFAAIATANYSLDRWKYNKAGAMVHTITQDTDVPTFAEAGYNFQNSARLNLTTPDTTIDAADLTFFSQLIEGYNWANLAQKPFTISFWVKATLPGVYCVGLRNSGGNASYVSEYTINSANTWEKKTIAVSASPAAGTWNYSNGIGITLDFIIACGTNRHTSPGAWQVGNFSATSNQVNGVNTGATDFRITGVCVYEGTIEDPAFGTFAKDFEGELAACQRHYQLLGRGIMGGSYSATQWVGATTFIVPMRASPTMSLTGVVTVHDPAVATFTQSSATILVHYANSTFTGAAFILNNFTGMTSFRPMIVQDTDRIAFDAEL